MTQEDKQLVLQDLCARLPYKVIVDYGYNAFDVHNGNYVKHGSKCILKCYLLDVFISPRQNEEGEYIKPYLRPLSSMTEEEQKEFVKFHCVNICPIVITEELTISNEAKMFEWLNEHHFDYRGLIDRGLAIEVTEDNNPYKN